MSLRRWYDPFLGARKLFNRRRTYMGVGFFEQHLDRCFERLQEFPRRLTPPQAVFQMAQWSTGDEYAAGEFLDWILHASRQVLITSEVAVPLDIACRKYGFRHELLVIQEIVREQPPTEAELRNAAEYDHRPRIRVHLYCRIGDLDSAQREFAKIPEWTTPSSLACRGPWPINPQWERAKKEIEALQAHRKTA